MAEECLHADGAIFKYGEIPIPQLKCHSMTKASFEWDPAKDLTNLVKHGISFSQAQYAFADPRRVIAEDLAHSNELEKRYFCFGKCGDGVVTVRFTYRQHVIRIFGAGYWRRGLRVYEKANKVHK